MSILALDSKFQTVSSGLPRQNVQRNIPLFYKLFKAKTYIVGIRSQDYISWFPFLRLDRKVLLLFPVGLPGRI